jgi:hypothetical protein
LLVPTAEASRDPPGTTFLKFEKELQELSNKNDFSERAVYKIIIELFYTNSRDEVVVKIILWLSKVPRTHSLTAVPQLSCRNKISLDTATQCGRCTENNSAKQYRLPIACRYLLPRATSAGEEWCQLLTAVMILLEVENVRRVYTGIWLFRLLTWSNHVPHRRQLYGRIQTFDSLTFFSKH